MKSKVGTQASPHPSHDKSKIKRGKFKRKIKRGKSKSKIKKKKEKKKNKNFSCGVM